MKKVFDEILRESYKRKDGVYIIGGSGINADHEHVEVWKDGKVVEKSDTIYRYGISGKEFEDTVWNKAEELSKKYKLKIFDGSNVGYSTFSDQYYIGMGSAEKSPYVKKGAEWDVTLKKVILYPDRDIVILRALNPDFEDLIFSGPERQRLEIYGLAVALYRQT